MATENALQVYKEENTSLAVISNAVDNVSRSYKMMEVSAQRAFNTGAMALMQYNVYQVQPLADDAAKSQENLNQQVQNGGKAAAYFKEKINKAFGDLKKKTIKAGVQFVTDSISMHNVQEEAESRLGIVMQRQMGANPEEIQRIKNLTADEQKKGVVRDEVQMSGAQHLASYLGSSDSLATLIPAMNDLAVQQKGLNVSSQDAASIGDMMGKVMQGQVDALSIAGASFSEAQKQIFMYGSEQERAAALAQFVSDHVGNMNAIMAETPQGQIQQLATSWQEVKEKVGAELFPAVMQFFSVLGANMPIVENLMLGLAGVISVVISAVSYLLEIAGTVAAFFQDNWGIIGPIIWGLAGALIAGAIAFGIYTVAVWLSNLATQSFFATLLANPIFWIAVAIGAVIAAIAAWIQSVGGIKIAWLMVLNSIMTKCEEFVIASIIVGNKIQNALDSMQLGIMGFKMSVLMTLGLLKVLGLCILQDFINGAIDRINALIGFAQKIGVTSIDLIAHVEFATDAAIEEEMKQKDRVKEYKAKQIQNMADRADREEGLRMKKSLYDAEERQRKAEIADLQKEQNNKSNSDNNWYQDPGGAQESWDNINANTGNTANNTAAMANSMDMAEEDLKYLRDVAEQEIINRFTTAELSVSMGGITNQINSQMDLDGIGNYLSGVIYETLETAAEGAY